MVTAEDGDLAFGRFVLQPRQRLLLAESQPVELGGRAFDLLLALVQADGALVGKDALLRHVWPGSVVEENNLHAQITAIRKALGPDREAVQTVPGRGYRLALPVTRRATPPAAVPQAAAPPPSRLSVVVLPFAELGGEPGAERLADSITESLTTDLARVLAGGSVVSRSTAFAYRGRAVTARRIGAELGVRYVIEGSVAVQGPRIRVNAQLIDAATDAHVWAERFDQPRGEDALATQDAIVGRLARMAALRLVSAAAQRSETEPQAAPTADDLALRAQALAVASRMSAEGVATARAMYRQALALDPNHMEAMAGLATVEVYGVVNSHTPLAERPARMEEAEALAARVLAIEPEHPVALRARAVALRAQGRFADAVVAAEAVLAASPGDPQACREIGLDRLYLGEPAEAARWFRRADLSSPYDPARWTWMQGLGRALLHLRQEAEAVAVLRIVVESNASYAFGHAMLAVALALTGDMPGARERHAEFLRRAPDPAARRPERLVPVPAERLSAAYRQGDARIFAVLDELAALHD